MRSEPAKCSTAAGFSLNVPGVPSVAFGSSTHIVRLGIERGFAPSLRRGGLGNGFTFHHIKNSHGFK